MNSQEVRKMRQDLEEQRRKLYKQSGLEAEQIAVKEEEINKTLKELDVLPIVRVYLAFEPSNSFLEEISRILEDKTGKKQIVEVEVNPALIAGVVLEMGGRFYDYSLKKIFEDKYAQL